MTTTATQQPSYIVAIRNAIRAEMDAQGIDAAALAERIHWHEPVLVSYLDGPRRFLVDALDVICREGLGISGSVILSRAEEETPQGHASTAEDEWPSDDEEALNVRYPHVFQGLDHDTGRDVVNEAFRLTATTEGDPTEEDLVHALRHLTWPTTDRWGMPVFKQGEDPCAEEDLAMTTTQPAQLDSCPDWCARKHRGTGLHNSEPIVAAENDDDPSHPLVIEILRDDLENTKGTWLDLCDVQTLRPSEARRYAAALIRAADLAEGPR